MHSGQMTSSRNTRVMGSAAAFSSDDSLQVA